MKHLLLLLALASAALAEPVKITRNDARTLNATIVAFDQWLAAGQEVELQDGDKKKVVRKPYELSAGARLALAKAKRATQAIADDSQLVIDAKRAEITPAATKDNPNPAPSAKDEAKANADLLPELRKTETLDLTLIDWGVFSGLETKLPVQFIAGLTPIIKNLP